MHLKGEQPQSKRHRREQWMYECLLVVLVLAVVNERQHSHVAAAKSRVTLMPRFPSVKTPSKTH